MDPDEKAALAQARAWVSHIGHDDGDRFSPGVASHLFTAEQLTHLRDTGDLAALLDSARATESDARLVRRWLQELSEAATPDGRTCPVCGRAVAGRRDRVYCSTNCRVKAHRAHGPDGERRAP